MKQNQTYRNMKIIAVMLIFMLCVPELSAAFETHIGGVKTLADRVEQLEKQTERIEQMVPWLKRLAFSGSLAGEAGFQKTDFSDPALEDEEQSDLALTTAELAIDMDISRHIRGHVLYLWEEDATDPVNLDEGYISIHGEGVSPLYLNVGKLYVPFGCFHSHFISDPLTLELGETRETAVVAGWQSDGLNVSAGIFNGDINKTGANDHINDFAVGSVFYLPNGLISGFELSAGLSFISNIADTEGLQGEDGVNQSDIEDKVPGVSGFVSGRLLERIFFEAEYLAAIDKFAPGELLFAGHKPARPASWNAELGYMVTENLEIAARYGGSSDCGTFLPEKIVGGVVAYALFENTSLAMEYLQGTFENNDRHQSLVAQLAVTF